MQSNEQLRKLLSSLEEIIDYCGKAEETFLSQIRSAHPSFTRSCANLIHYMALRNFDIRDLQLSLAALGLSSLGRAEGHVLASLHEVRNNLCRMLEGPELKDTAAYINVGESNYLLQRRTEALFGPERNGRKVRIMVTLPGEAADDYGYVLKLVQAGMDCARINCAHDDKEVWLRMIGHIKRAQKETGLSCPILMDLAGFKLRTGPLKPGPRMVRLRPKRDFFRNILAPAKIWLSGNNSAAPDKTYTTIPVDPEWLRLLRAGDTLHFMDFRGKDRRLEIAKVEKGGCIAELYKRAYIQTGTTFELNDKNRSIPAGMAGILPALEQKIILKPGDLLRIDKLPVEGEGAKYGADGIVLKPAHISCSSPVLFESARQGEPILFDDGKIEGIIHSVDEDFIMVQITQARKGGSKLGADKGINLPQTRFGLQGLQEKDRKDLRFVAQHADIVNMSFVNEPEDVSALQENLRSLNASHIPIMLKIETQRGFNNLPRLLLALMQGNPAGVMIARGDLAIECGWQRLAEIQEEILWLCEAGHIPVVWATQVLETLSKTGAPSRAEITDAAMSQRAECVMLNKGPHILQTIEMLSDILNRMQAHQHKKTPMLRNLKLTGLLHPGN